MLFLTTNLETRKILLYSNNQNAVCSEEVSAYWAGRLVAGREPFVLEKNDQNEMLPWTLLW